MQEKNELNDIILNRGGSTNNSKKIILAVATLGVILIVVVLLMNTLTSNGTDNLPQAVLPPQPKAKTVMQPKEEPLFEEVEVIEEETPNNNLDQIAQKLKEQSKENTVVTKKEPLKETVTKKTVAKKTVAKKITKPAKKIKSTAKQYYVQVGSFSKYEPNKQFLKSITDKGFTYKYHKVVKNNKTLNKVLVGPFNNEKNARNALRTIRSSIEAGAFLVRI